MTPEDAVVGGWEFNSINTAHTGTPLNVFYVPTAAYDVTGLSNDYRGQAFQRPNVTGASTTQTTKQMINNYYGGFAFTLPPVNAPFGNLRRNAFRAPGFEQPFVTEGLMRLSKATGSETARIASWDAAFWPAGGSAAVMLRNPGMRM